MWNAIGPVRTIAGLLRYRRAGVSIGAAIQVNFAAARDECAILSHAGLKNDLGARLANCPERLIGAKSELDRTANHARETRRDGFSLDAALGAVTAADVRNDHAYGTERQTENTRELLANGKWALCRAPHREHAGFEVRDANMRLHRIVLGAGKIKNVFEDAVGLAKTRFDIATVVTKMKTDIGVIVDNVAAAPAVTRILTIVESLMDKRSAGFQRLIDGEYRWQLVIIDLDQLQCLCCSRILCCCDRGYHVADVTDFLRS